MKNLKTIITLFILVLIASCSKDSYAPDAPDASVLVITNISPITGPKNTAVTITGTGFSTTASNNAVTINGKVCPVVNSTATQLTITIPPSAGSGKIKVAVAGANAESVNFEFVVTTTVTTFAGSSTGSQDGQGTNAQFDFPNGITIDATGNLYVADFGNHRIRKITPTGFVTTVAGFTFGFENGQGILAKFFHPQDVTIDASGRLFIADRSNDKIRTISTTGFVNTITGNNSGFSNGNQFDAKFNQPEGIVIDASGNLFVADTGNKRIRRIVSLFQTPMTSTFAGSGSIGSTDGQGLAASFNSPSDIAIDLQGNLFISDFNLIRKISSTGLVTTIAGSSSGIVGGFADGPGSVAKFDRPIGMVCDSNGNLFIADSRNNKIRKISPSGVVTTVAGTTQGFSDGNVLTAQFSQVKDVTIDAQGNLYVTDASNDRIRKITFD